MQILYESISTSQITIGGMIFDFVLALTLLYFTLDNCHKNKLKGITTKILIIASIFVTISILIFTINQRINYETIHTKKITFTEQQNFKVNDEITICPELKGYTVTEIEGKIYTVELREKAK